MIAQAAVGAVSIPEAVVFAAGMIAMVYFIAGLIATDHDRAWLPAILVTGLILKLIGSTVRHYVLFTVYRGVGDATGYHARGLDLAETFRGFQIPPIADGTFGSTGTHFVGWFTGLLYTPYRPSTLGGFWIYGFLAFLGTIAVYAGFRRAAAHNQWKRLLWLLMLWPTLVYWPSSIGKEALIMAFLGPAVYAISRALETYEFRWLAMAGGFTAVVGVVRIHVAALVAAATLLAMLFSRHPAGGAPRARRVGVIVVGVLLMVPLVVAVAANFGVDVGESIEVSDFDPVVEAVGETTGQGGSAVTGGTIQSLSDVPAGILKVLFQPFPWEAGNGQMLAASAEGVALGLLLLLRLPRLVSNLRRIRHHPYLVFCAFFTIGFIVAWSAVNNLGILARQRSLMLPFVLILVAGLGWRPVEEPAPPPEPAARPRPSPLPAGG